MICSGARSTMALRISIGVLICALPTQSYLLFTPASGGSAASSRSHGADRHHVHTHTVSGGVVSPFSHGTSQNQNLDCASKTSGGGIFDGNKCQAPTEQAPAGTQLFCRQQDVFAGTPWSMLGCGPEMNCEGGQLHAGDNPDVVVAIHGGPGQSVAYLAGLLKLTPQIPVLLYDQAHSGRSTTLGANIGEDIEATMLKYVRELHHLLESVGARKAHLVGHSFGAAIAIDFALQVRGSTTPATFCTTLIGPA